jgi:hypothetical protein
LIDDRVVRMQFTRDRRDRGLIRGGNWLANDTSDAHVALVWAEVGRGLLHLLWGLRLLSLSISS